MKSLPPVRAISLALACAAGLLAGPAAAVGGSAGRSDPAGRVPVIRAGLCTDNVPKTVHAGDVVAVTCRYQRPIRSATVVLTPGFSDSYAEPTYVLVPAVDYTYQVDLDSNTDDAFVVLIRILHTIAPPYPTPDVDHYGLLLAYQATGSRA